jgi:ubiquinone/menaquinone biosynthesis C-methylase UbiE
MQNMAEHVCPYWAGYFLANRLRRLLQNPCKILAPYIKPGMTVLDVGSAMGFFSLPMAEMVGPGGKVVCVDVQPKMLQALCRRATEAGLAERIETHASAEDSIGLHGQHATFDFALAFMMLHEVGNQTGFLREIYQLLKPGAPLLLEIGRAHV